MNKPFKIRGVLPWHNFLCGPSAWNEEDYRKYLDNMQAKGINLVAFHNYTGGAERYNAYIEPIIKTTYRGVLPVASFDTSLTNRWGYRPLKLSDYAYGSGEIYPEKDKYDAFGAECMLSATSNEERYTKAQNLMRSVMDMAHDRGMKFAIGFELGVIPAEFLSLLDAAELDNAKGTTLGPDSAAGREILYNIIDDLLESYPAIDQIWLWHFELTDYVGVDADWVAGYVQAAYDYIKSKRSDVEVILSGWGGAKQLPSMLKDLDQKLPKDIVFTCLNPEHGFQFHSDALAEVAKNRQTWSIPWLESDARMWTLNPRVGNIIESVKKAAKDELDGVIAIHWRTEEIEDNFEVFGRLAANNEDLTVESFYEMHLPREFGNAVGSRLLPLFIEADTTLLFKDVHTKDYFGFEPKATGRLSAEQKAWLDKAITIVENGLKNDSDTTILDNLNWLHKNFLLFIQLDSIGKCLLPAYELHSAWIMQGKQSIPELKTQAQAALTILNEAPVKEMLQDYTTRVRSRGELGVLSSLNQRVATMYTELNEFLQTILQGN